MRAEIKGHEPSLGAIEAAERVARDMLADVGSDVALFITHITVAQINPETGEGVTVTVHNPVYDNTHAPS